jgi:deoxyribodipyrimidine photo-lyase
MSILTVPSSRIRKINGRTVSPSGSWVVYWMTAQRRVFENHSLDRAVWWCRQLDLPLVIFEPLRCDYPYASVRHHAFIIQGMAENARRVAKTRAHYLPFVERVKGQGKGLLARLSSRAAVVVTDDHPGFFFPGMVKTAGEQVSVLLEAVDGTGFLPHQEVGRTFPSAYAFRRVLQKSFLDWAGDMPSLAPLEMLPNFNVAVELDELLHPWPLATPAELKASAALLSSLPIDQTVEQVKQKPGGSDAALFLLDRFMSDAAPDYSERRRHPDENGESGLSPYLHHGHIGTHTILKKVFEAADWSPHRVQGKKPLGKKLGFLGHLTARFSEHAGTFGQVPPWAKETLHQHVGDPREHLYSLEELAQGKTSDSLWNAAAWQLLDEGVIHNYLRMLWGKWVIEWTPTPEIAFSVLTELNNRFALDGRDPNSDSGIGWVFGLYDRPFFERACFGKVRCMTSRSTLKKLKLKKYLEKQNKGALLFPDEGTVAGR